MSGLASMNRYHQFDWQRGAPYPGELEYLGWAAYGRQNSGSDTRVKSVTDNTYSYARARR